MLFVLIILLNQPSLLISIKSIIKVLNFFCFLKILTLLKHYFILKKINPICRIAQATIQRTTKTKRGPAHISLLISPLSLTVYICTKPGNPKPNLGPPSLALASQFYMVP